MARDVMRFAGPRMIWLHPFRAVNHLLDKLRRVEHPMKTRQALSRLRDATGPGIIDQRFPNLKIRASRPGKRTSSGLQR